jgi:hypothetical protein
MTATVIPFPSGRAPEPWVTKKQLARHLNYSTRWIEQRQREGVPHRRDGNGHCRYRISEAEAWLEERRP